MSDSVRFFGPIVQVGVPGRAVCEPPSGKSLGLVSDLVIGRNFCEIPRYSAVTSVV